MALSYTERSDLYGDFTVDTTTENLAFGDTLMNAAEKQVVNSRAWPFIQRVFTKVTVASQQFYNLPVNYKKLIGNPTITVGSSQYTPTEAPDRATWDRINSTTGVESDVPQYFFIFKKQVGFWPTPSSAGNTITFPYEAQAKNMSIADYTTGSIVSIANGATTVTGTGTTWTAGMAGKYIRIDDDNSATTGDNEWYEIDSVTNTTTLELVIPYEGTTIAAATQGYTIGQLSILPDGYDNLPVYKAAQQYFVQEEKLSRATFYKNLYDELLAVMKKDQGSKTSNLVVDEVTSISNPNLYITE